MVNGSKFNKYLFLMTGARAIAPSRFERMAVSLRKWKMMKGKKIDFVTECLMVDKTLTLDETYLALYDMVFIIHFDSNLAERQIKFIDSNNVDMALRNKIYLVYGRSLVKTKEAIGKLIKDYEILNQVQKYSLSLMDDMENTIASELKDLVINNSALKPRMIN